MNRTSRVGLSSELAFQKLCVDLGLEVAVPVGPERYDLLLRLAEQWHRVQVKTGLYRDGGITFNTCSNAEGVGKKVDYVGFVEAIGVYCPQLDRAYLVPISDCAASTARLRVDPPRNNQVGRVRWADQYLLSTANLGRFTERSVV